MRFEWGNSKLKRLFTEKVGAEAYPPTVVKAFYQRIQAVIAAKDERDLRALKSLHYEKLKGSGERYSIRLNDQWRLEFEREKGKEGICLRILEMSKHYGD